MTKKRAKILIIDDDASVRELLHIYLESYEYDVLAFDSGEPAVAFFEQHQDKHGIALVLVDNIMPGIDGITTFQQIHAIDSELPVVMLTAFPSIGLAMRFIELGGTNFITKPLVPESHALAVAVQEVLNYKQAMEAQSAQYPINRKTLATQSLVAKAESKTDNHPQTKQTPWKILIVDDDKEVHSVTYCILQEFKFDGRPLELHSAFSTNEVKEWINKHDDAALILLDIMMETKHAGFDLAKYIRDELGNKMTRIIFRTGRAGDFPEQKIVHDYEIDGYLIKDHTTPHSLTVAVTTSLRAYRDLTLIEEQHQEIIKQKDRAKQSEKAVLSFLSSLQHETGTKAHHVLSYLEMALASAQAGDLDKVISRLQTAHTAGNHLKQYHQELSLVAHLIAGNVPFEFSEHDIQVVINEAWESIAQFAIEKNISLEIDGNKIQPIQIDHSHLKKALSSLLHNAVKFSPEGSIIRTSLTSTDNNIKLAVHDNGSGIAQDLLAHILEPFTKERPDEKASGEKGFGLIIVRYIAEAHNGTLSVENSAKGGAIFTLTLPIHHDTSSE
ncbi:response regulator [Pseudomonadota bacterium]